MVTKTLFNRIIPLLIVLSLVLSLLSCGTVLSNNDLLKNDAVTYRLSMEESIPEFNQDLFATVEVCFNTYYYIALESNESLAAKTIAAYDEFIRDEIDAEDKAAVTKALIDCYIYAIGDPYSFYRLKEETNDYDTDMSGSFVGIGVTVIRNDLEGTILITGVEQDSPAFKAGIQVDDYIIGVNGERVSEIGALATVNKIKGEVDTEVSVTVLRGNDEITFELIRKKITETTVSYQMIDGTKTGYIKIKNFKGNTADQFKEAVDAIEAAGANAVIFDVRQNPGGYLSAVTSMISYLVPSNTKIASFSSSKPTVYSSHGTAYEPTDHVLTIPLVVLCNENSASASELFTAAMRDYNDMGVLSSTVVGNVTYKKGIMQSTISFNDGSSLTLTTALYNPPSDTNFHGVGVTPDRFVLDGEDYIDVALEEIEKLISNAPSDI